MAVDKSRNASLRVTVSTEVTVTLVPGKNSYGDVLGEPSSRTGSFQVTANSLDEAVSKVTTILALM